ncbi:MAG: cyclic nucleotide-binding domain-containing protein [Tepidiformaceae bacterium]
MSSTMDALVQVPMFRDLNKKALERLERIARQRSFSAGDVIVKEGDEGVGFFLITSGKVTVTRDGRDLNSLGQGEFFGEMALLDNYRRSATVTAAEATKCLALLRSDFVAELRSNADLAVEMLVLMSRRLRDADERLAHD